MPHRPMLALCLLIGAAPALAQEHPPLAPTRDADVTYRVLGPHPGTLHMRTLASSGLTRMEMPNQHGYAIMDRRNHQMTLVMTEQRMYMEMPAGAAQQQVPNLDQAGRFTRQGTDTVAGLICNVWNHTGERGTGSICITDDGVLLRASDSTGQRGIEATEVSLAPQADADFHPPAGFTQQAVPQMPPGGMMGMPPGRPPAH